MPRLLIVDDERDMLDFLERVFRRDYEVVRAHSVEEAEQALASGAVDVVITDRRMPRRSGLELLEIVAAQHPKTVRVLLTGYADSLVDEKVTQWRLVDAWVSKPIDSAALREAVTDAIARRSQPATST
ncbi:MAG TPA: response regulator [Polyangia bacterium]|nr:response regulator [Polyangia bacterium]